MHASMQEPWSARLLQFYQHQIATHPSYVYGEGFRGAHAGVPQVWPESCSRSCLPVQKLAQCMTHLYTYIGSIYELQVGWVSHITCM